jgi:alpha-ketoglutarate-dependent taurine dioxygenase
LKDLKNFKRSAVRLSEKDMVATYHLPAASYMPLVAEPTIEGVELVGWACNNRRRIDEALIKCGAVLFRGFELSGIDEFEQLINALSDGEILDYTYRSTPRTAISGKIYTSTEYPAHQFIPLHNEMAYSRSWPMRLYFLCSEPAEEGGETLIADSRIVFQRIHPAIVEKFARKQVLYVRNYGDGLDLSWQTVFQTADKSVVERYCIKAGIEYEWKDNSRLRTSQVCQAVIRHPETGEMVWFNQAHLFHISGLEPQVREALCAGFKKEDLPRNAYYGDGSEIELSALDDIREAYSLSSQKFHWRRSDVLLLDNMLVAHGRAPYVGPRKIVVGMAQPFSITTGHVESNNASN